MGNLSRRQLLGLAGGAFASAALAGCGNDNYFEQLVRCGYSIKSQNDAWLRIEKNRKPYALMPREDMSILFTLGPDRLGPQDQNSPTLDGMIWRNVKNMPAVSGLARAVAEVNGIDTKTFAVRYGAQYQYIPQQVKRTSEITEGCGK